MTRRPVRHLLLATLVVAAAPVVAAAQPSSAQAEQLFRDGRRLMSEGKLGEACAAFEASQKLDPTPATLLNLADCREKNQQIASAWGHFLEAERQTRHDPKQKAFAKTARERAARLEPRVSYLIVNVPDESRVEGLVITRNGELVDPLTWNRALPVDGGDYVIEGKAPGHEAWSTRVTVGPEAHKESVDVPRFKAVLGPKPGEQPAPDGPEDDDRIAPEGGLGGKRKAAIGAGAVGVVALGAAGFFELSARSKYDDSTRATNNQDLIDLYDQAVQRRKIAIGAAVFGGVCVGAAAVLWLTGGTASESESELAWRLTPTVGADVVGLTLRGGF
jgi:hypothetical protein